MDKSNKISYARRLINYFKSREIIPTKEEEDMVWNNIISQIKSPQHKQFSFNRWQTSVISLSIAAMLTGIIFLLTSNRKDESEILYAAYQSLNEKSDHSSNEILILSENKKITNVNNHTTIDYSKSAKEVTIGKKIIEKSPETKYHQLIVPNGKRTCLILADGSTLHVNAGTRVVYPDRFKKDRREIFVDGEIYIDVVKNAKMPFVVTTTSCNIEVLGTSFNVNSYSKDTDTQIALVNGSIKLKDKQNKEIILKPNELAVLSQSNIKGKYKVNASDYAAWTDGLLKLNATPLSSVFKSLERYYGITISFSKEVGQMKMYGSLDLECPIEEVLRRIKYTAPISYINKDDKFEVTKENQ